MSTETAFNLPAMPNKPRTGFAAWEATIGYIATQYSPDVLLTLRAVPRDADTLWEGELSWGEQTVTFSEASAVEELLARLWLQVESEHDIFKTPADAVRKPTGYSAYDWLDADTKDALERLMWVASVVFKQDWLLVLIYQPTEISEVRVQIRLLARESTVQLSARGASVRDAAMRLYRNATPYFSSSAEGL